MIKTLAGSRPAAATPSGLLTEAEASAGDVAKLIDAINTEEIYRRLREPA